MRPKQTDQAETLSDLKFYQYVSLHKQTKDFDVIIIGGSYAGLSAAMTLGRARRKVLIIDSGNPCNIQTPQAHNFITQDGEVASAIAAKAKEQVLKYNTVKFMKDKAVKVIKDSGKFNVETRRNEKFSAKKILFATGVIDMIPDIPGFSECWGISVLHCPYCNGYEVADRDIGIIANADVAYEMIKLLYTWSTHLTLFTNGVSTLTKEQKLKISQKNIPVIEQEIASLDHKKGQIKNIVFKDAGFYPIDAIFCKLAFLQATDIPQKQLGCELTEEGFIKTDIFQRTSVHGVYSAGDNAVMPRVITVSAATGAIAGMNINKEISEESF
ncbi:MAG: NAD(P)/FAD-dependent oxidoreductase [Ferruginibacter sp.]